MDLCVSEKPVCMATSKDHRFATVTARDGVDTRTQDNSAMPAGGSGETTRLGDGDQVRGGQTAAQPTRRQMGLHSKHRTRRAAADETTPVMNAKMMCLWKPAQSGKTRTIMEMIRANEEVATHLNVVICSNIRLLVSQTAARMTRELYTGSDAESEVSDAESADDRIEGDVFSWMSGTTRTNISVRELADRIKEEEVNMVVCCSHKARFRYLMELLGNLEKSKHFNRPISVWIDEADVSVKTWSDQAYDFTSFTKVARLCLVSATFNSVVKTYGRIKVLGFESTFPDCYLPLEECNVVEHEGVADVVANLATVLEQRPELCAPGVRLFAPGMLEVATHDGIAEYLKAKGFAVMVLNGQRKCIVCPDDTIIPLALRMDPSTPDEIGKVLPGLYATHGLARWPFAVTGQMCLGRGITFQSSEFLFDYGVLPNLGDPATAYQCVARLLGNVKHLEGFQAPTVFMDKEMVTMTRVQEKMASNVAKLVLEKGWADVGPEELEFVLHGDEEQYVADVRETETHGRPAVPEIVEMTEEEFATIPTRRDPEGKKRAVLAILATRDAALATKLAGYECKRVNIPESTTSASYKNSIGVATRKYQTRQPCSATFVKEETAKGSIWQCFVDVHTTPKRLCFIYVNPA